MQCPLTRTLVATCVHSTLIRPPPPRDFCKVGDYSRCIPKSEQQVVRQNGFILQEQVGFTLPASLTRQPSQCAVCRRVCATRDACVVNPTETSTRVSHANVQLPSAVDCEQEVPESSGRVHPV